MSVRVRAANEGKDTYIENPRRKWTCSVLLDGLDSLLLIIDSGGCRRELLKGVKPKQSKAPGFQEIIKPKAERKRCRRRVRRRPRDGTV